MTPTAAPAIAPTTVSDTFWSKCISEVGSTGLNCAKCQDNIQCNLSNQSGSLNCFAISPKERKDRPQFCPDSLFFLAFWYPLGMQGTGRCRSIQKRLQQGSARVSIYTGGYEKKVFHKSQSLLPGSNGTFDGPFMLTKATTAHPHKAAPNIGAILFKRIVMHPHTKTHAMVGDTFKIGYCIKCPKKIFSSIYSTLLTKAPGNPSNPKEATKQDLLDHEKFVDDCLVFAFNSTSHALKRSYQCDEGGVDQAKFMALLSSY